MTRQHPQERASYVIASRRIGCTVAEYAAHVDAAEGWCSACRQWMPEWRFGVDESRSTLRKAACRVCMTVVRRKQRRKAA